MIQHLKQWELSKVEREILTHGEKYLFSRYKLDERNERTDETEDVAEIKGLFHTSKSFLTKTVGDGNVTHGKGQPMVLTSYSEGKVLLMDDIVTIGDMMYHVTGLNNVEQYGILLDVSLEEVIP